MKLTFLIPRCSTSSRCASTMSFTLTIGKLVPYRRPLTGFTLDGPLRGNNAVKTCTTLHPARKSVTMERYNLRTPLRELPAINYYILNFVNTTQFKKTVKSWITCSSVSNSLLIVVRLFVRSRKTQQRTKWSPSRSKKAQHANGGRGSWKLIDGGPTSTPRHSAGTPAICSQRRNSRAAVATSNLIGAHHEEFVGVQRTSGTDKLLPPSGKFVVLKHSRKQTFNQ